MRGVVFIVLLTLVGAYGFRITPATIAGITVVSVLMLLAWWYYTRERPHLEASSVQSKAGRVEGSDGSASITPRLSPNYIPGLARKMERRIRPAQAVEAGTLPAPTRPVGAR